MESIPLRGGKTKQSSSNESSFQPKHTKQNEFTSENRSNKVAVPSCNTPGDATGPLPSQCSQSNDPISSIYNIAILAETQTGKSTNSQTVGSVPGVSNEKYNEDGNENGRGIVIIYSMYIRIYS